MVDYVAVYEVGGMPSRGQECYRFFASNYDLAVGIARKHIPDKAMPESLDGMMIAPSFDLERLVELTPKVQEGRVVFQRVKPDF